MLEGQIRKQVAAVHMTDGRMYSQLKSHSCLWFQINIRCQHRQGPGSVSPRRRNNLLLAIDVRRFILQSTQRNCRLCGGDFVGANPVGKILQLVPHDIVLRGF